MVLNKKQYDIVFNAVMSRIKSPCKNCGGTAFGIDENLFYFPVWVLLKNGNAQVTDVGMLVVSAVCGACGLLMQFQLKALGVEAELRALASE